MLHGTRIALGANLSAHSLPGRVLENVAIVACSNGSPSVRLSVWQLCLHSGHRQWHRLLKPVTATPKSSHSHSHTHIHAYIPQASVCRRKCVNGVIKRFFIASCRRRWNPAWWLRPRSGGFSALRSLLRWLCLTFSGPRPFGIATNTNGTLKPRLSTGTFSLPPMSPEIENHLARVHWWAMRAEIIISLSEKFHAIKGFSTPANFYHHHLYLNC